MMRSREALEGTNTTVEVCESGQSEGEDVTYRGFEQDVCPIGKTPGRWNFFSSLLVRILT